MQNVHWKMRAERDLTCWAAARCVMGARRRRRRSAEEYECLELLDREEPMVSSELEDSRVSKLETEGA